MLVFQQPQHLPNKVIPVQNKRNETSKATAPNFRILAIFITSEIKHYCPLKKVPKEYSTVPVGHRRATIGLCAKELTL